MDQWVAACSLAISAGALILLCKESIFYASILVTWNTNEQHTLQTSTDSTCNLKTWIIAMHQTEVTNPLWHGNCPEGAQTALNTFSWTCHLIHVYHLRKSPAMTSIGWSQTAALTADWRGKEQSDSVEYRVEPLMFLLSFNGLPQG